MIDLFADEQVVLEVRRHWFIFFLQTLYLIIFIIVPLAAWSLLIYTDTFITNPELIPFFSFATAGWFLLTWVAFFIGWTNFYLDAWLITNKRIINIEQFALFDREVAEFRIDNIQDITVSVDGFMATILGFGDILVETAGERKSCVIKDAPHPEHIKELVSHLLQTDLDKAGKPARI